MLENPKIISICSICKSKTNMCKLVQYHNSGNYRLICDVCYTNPNPQDVIINVSNYTHNNNVNNNTSNCEKLKEKICNIYCKTKLCLCCVTQKCIKGIKSFIKKIQIKERLSCCKKKTVYDDTRILQ